MYTNMKIIILIVTILKDKNYLRLRRSWNEQKAINYTVGRSYDAVALRLWQREE
jgi:hypothetical protein